MATKQNLIFKDAEKAKAAIMKSQQKEIKDLYVKWADDIGKKAEMYAKKTTPSSGLQEIQMKTLKKQLTAASKQISNEIYGIIKNNMYLMSNAVVGDSKKWMKSLGFGDEAANMMFTNIPDSTVRNIITGQIYDSGWSLSKAIWSDNEKNLKDIYAIVGKGIAENSSIYDISKELETYVNPNKKLPWNFKGKDGVKIFKKSVDYNAQRLARTLVQHGYQQSFIAVTKDNPLVEEYLWLANGSRVCPICKARNGKHYSKDNLPMDHPNGMCTMVPVVNSNMIDDLADWVKNPDKNPKLTKFAKKLGYKESQIKAGDVVKIKGANAAQKTENKFTDLQDKYLSKYGYTPNNMPKNYNEWFGKLSVEDMFEISSLQSKKGLSYDEWFDKYLKSVQNTQVAQKAEKAVKAKTKKIPKFTNAQEKYLAKYGYSIDNMPKDYDEWFIKLTFEDNLALSKWGIKANKSVKELFDKYLNVKKYKTVKVDDIADVNTAANVGDEVVFGVDAYSKEAKRQAKMFASRDGADRYYRPKLDKFWDKTTEKEKYSVWEYTQNSNPINKSLSGYHDTWDRDDFKGLGKTDLGHEDKWRKFNTDSFEKKFGKDGHKDYKTVVEKLTNVIDKSKMDDSVYLVRGSDAEGLAGLLEGNLISFDDARKLIKKNNIEDLKKVIKGQKFTNHSFTSTGIASGTGFNDDIAYEIFAPKGTKYIYAEPASYYGNTISGESLYKTGQSYSSVGSEAEVILQRGTTFTIRDVKKEGSKIKIIMDVTEQPDYFKTGLEHTHTKGKTYYTK